MSRGRCAALVAFVAMIVSAVPASAATLVVQREDVWYPWSAEPIAVHHIVYDGEGLEANRVTIAPDAARTGVLLADPGIPIRTGEASGGGLPSPGGGPAPMAAWTCSSPGTSTATCAATPGYQCWSLMCGGPGPATFEGRLKVAGNSGDDAITIEPSNFRSTVWGVYGNDTIDVYNGQPDNVFCGAGLDAVQADPYDWVEGTCEDVIRR